LLSRITSKTTVETTLEAVRRLTRHGINQYHFFMVGYPDEPPDALECTLDFVVELKKINPAISLFLNYVTPLPGSEVFRIAVERGHLEAPRSFEDWARFDYMLPNLLDITNDYRRCVSRFQEFLNLFYSLPRGTRLPARCAASRSGGSITATSDFRWSSRCFPHLPALDLRCCQGRTLLSLLKTIAMNKSALAHRNRAAPRRTVQSSGWFAARPRSPARQT
jgi:hypothetical protein